jgi:hypothetical protein
MNKEELELYDKAVKELVKGALTFAVLGLGVLTCIVSLVILG